MDKRKKLTEKDKINMVKDKAEGFSLEELAAKYKLHKNYASQVMTKYKKQIARVALKNQEKEIIGIFSEVPYRFKRLVDKVELEIELIERKELTEGALYTDDKNKLYKTLSKLLLDANKLVGMSNHVLEKQGQAGSGGNNNISKLLGDSNIKPIYLKGK